MSTIAKPIRLSDSELDAVMTAAQPLAVEARDAFLQKVADALARCSEIGPGAVYRYIARNMDRLDPEMALAIVSVPVELSGVLESDRKVLVDKALQAQHGDAIVKTLELERAVGVAEHAVEAVRAEIARDVGVPDPHQWNQLAAPHEKRAVAPYLKKCQENGQEVIRVLKWNGNGGTWGQATQQDIAEGVYCGSFQEWQQARKEAP
jgi:hypothetical protein